MTEVKDAENGSPAINLDVDSVVKRLFLLITILIFIPFLLELFAFFSGYLHLFLLDRNTELNRYEINQGTLDLYFRSLSILIGALATALSVSIFGTALFFAAKTLGIKIDFTELANINSAQALIALLVVGSYVGLAFYKGDSENGIKELALVVTGFYFGTKSAAVQKGSAGTGATVAPNETEPPKT